MILSLQTLSLLTRSSKHNFIYGADPICDRSDLFCFIRRDIKRLETAADCSLENFHCSTALQAFSSYWPILTGPHRTS